MRPRGHAAGNVAFPADAQSAGKSHGAFRVDIRLGHAWFARSGKTKLPATRGPEILPVLRRAELVLANQGRAIARRVTRIPADAIVALGAALSSASPRSAPASMSRVAAAVPAADIANDNKAQIVRKRGALLREVMFLLLFGATLAGTYYLGRMHAFQKIIVVPEPMAGKVV